MKQYGITVREILERTVIVEAENIDDAIRQVDEAIGRDELLLDMYLDYEGSEIEPSGYWDGGEVPDGEDTDGYYHLSESDY